MQRGSSMSPSNGPVPARDCTFCQYERISTYILKETTHFLVIADHAPLVEGHLLIIPKQHYTCYGAVISAADNELLALKHEITNFMTHYYTTPTYWEHGVFRQTVFHAHLHAMPFGPVEYNPEARRHQQIVHSQQEIRNWYTQQGHYFYLEDTKNALIFAPDSEDYSYVIQTVFRSGIVARTQQAKWRTSEQRQREGKPLITALVANWQTFQQ